MTIKEAEPPAPRNAAVARYRYGRQVYDLLEETWQRSQWRDEPMPTFGQIQAVLLADDALRIRDGEPSRWLRFGQ